MRIVLCSSPVDRAESIASTLVEEGHAACVSATPVQSTYRWEGRLCRDDEVLLIIKVSAAGVDALRTRLRELHPYQLPEILSLPVDSNESFAPYVEWVRTSCRR